MEASVSATLRVRDIENVSERRASRLVAVEKSSLGQIAEVLSQSTSSFQYVYVVKLLDVVPGIGKVKGRRLLSSLGLDGFSLVSHLTPDQRKHIIEASRNAV